MVFDYKTSDTARTPEEVHRDGDTWVDLQLPLYRHLVARLGVGKPLRLAYILLPKDVSKTGEKVAEWDAAALDEADAVAADVIRGVRKETFGPPVSPPPPFFEEFGPICLDEQFRPEPTETADEEGTEAE